MRNHLLYFLSLSARRAWIEIDCGIFAYVVAEVALRKESVDRNGRAACFGTENHKSLSARRAWIEMRYFALNIRPLSVALRKESVDRNQINIPVQKGARVALRKESVDRNCSCGGRVTPRLRSLSARRAWIEIAHVVAE